MLETKTSRAFDSQFLPDASMITYDQVLDRLKSLEERLSSVIYSHSELPLFLRPQKELIEFYTDYLNQEIKYCNFYLKTVDRSDELHRWRYYTFENRPFIHHNHRPHLSNTGDAWIFTNGKVKATIDINSHRGVMTRVQLFLENDAEDLVFFQENPSKVAEKFFHKASSVVEYVDDLKELVEQRYLSEYQFPCYCLEEQNFRILEGLLFVLEEE